MTTEEQIEILNNTIATLEHKIEHLYEGIDLLFDKIEKLETE